MDSANADQAAFWNAEPGENWVRHQPDMDILQREITERLLGACAPRTGEAVLDIGCGAGGSTFALGEAVGPSGRVHGLDISAPLLARAEERRRGLGMANVSFEAGDAQDHPLEPGGFDLVASRLGTMFFSDPVAAFRNVARALRPGGRMAFAAWAGPEHNPWFALPGRVAAERLGPIAAPPPDAPGPMAFRDSTRVIALLQAAGLDGAASETLDVSLHHPGGLDPVLGLVGGLGIVPRLVREKGGTEADLAAILDGVRAALAPFRCADGIRVPARIHVFSATAHG
jgi:SAM-dependent methyltransferase